jgi:hypothetical protein
VDDHKQESPLGGLWRDPCYKFIISLIWSPSILIQNMLSAKLFILACLVGSFWRCFNYCCQHTGLGKKNVYCLQFCDEER